MDLMFSILVPVYNVEKFIDKSIISVLKQTYTNYELILVDDGSTDKSGIICDMYAATDKRIRVIHNTNHGLLYTRRIAFSLARGDYFVILDSDDTIKETALQTLYETIYEYDSDCIIYGYERVLNGQIISRTVDKELLHITNKHDIYMRVFLDSNYNAIWRKAFKRSLLDGRDYSQFYHLSLGEDLLQSIEILQNARSITFIPTVLYEYTVNPTSMTQTANERNYKCDMTIRNLVLNFLENSTELTSEDLIIYKAFCLKILCKELIRISKFGCSYYDKQLLFEKLNNEEYNRKIITEMSKCKVDLRIRVLLTLFKQKNYKLLSFLCGLV